MRFGDTLRYNARPEWWFHYVAYDELKCHVSAIRQLKCRLVMLGADGSEIGYVPMESEATASPLQSPVPDRPSSDEEENVVTPASGITTSDTKIAHATRRSASKTVLAELDGVRRTKSLDHSLIARMDDGLNPEAYRMALGVQRSPEAAGRAAVADDMDHRQLQARLREEHAKFMARIGEESKKVNVFYDNMSLELKRVKNDLEAVVLSWGHLQHVLSEAQGENAALLGSREDERGIPTLDVAWSSDMDATSIREDLLNFYTDCTDIIAFSQWNASGFDKILKKHDKCSGLTTRKDFMSHLKSSTNFMETKDMEQLKRDCERMYANAFTKGNRSAAIHQLSKDLREKVTFERSTVWRESMRHERRVSALRRSGNGEGGQQKPLQFVPKVRPIAAASLVFLFILLLPGFVEMLPREDGPDYSHATLMTANRCFALLIAVTDPLSYR